MKKFLNFRKKWKKKKEEINDFKNQVNIVLEHLYRKLVNNHKDKQILDELFTTLNLDRQSSSNNLEDIRNKDQMSVDKLKEVEAELKKAEAQTQSKKKELERVYSELRDVHEQFDECQNILAAAKERISELEGLNDVNATQGQLKEVTELEEKLEDARRTKIQTLTFLDLEIGRLRTMLMEQQNSHPIQQLQTYG